MSLEWLVPLWMLLAGVAFLGGLALFLVAAARGAVRARRFSERSGSAGLLLNPRRRFQKGLLVSLMLGLAALALADPRYGVEVRQVSHRGRDVVFVLDVSKSMLATDVAPNRLKRARLDILDSLPRLAGHRLGLIAFAGRPKEICPLTHDHRHFVARLQQAGPETVPVGGTNIGDALRKALDLIEQGGRLGRYKDVVLITDGQDLGGFYEEAAKKAGELGVAVYTVGIGLEDPAHIPLEDGTFLTHEGKEVTTALNPEPLQLISNYSAGGFYSNLSSNPRWMQDLLARIEKKEMADLGSFKDERKIPRYQWILGAGLLLWAAGTLLSERSRGVL